MHILYLIFINPLMLFMKVILTTAYNLTHSYGISIVILSLIVNTILLPLYYLAEKWQNSERNIKLKMAPQLAKAKKELQGEERYDKTVEIYKEHSYHPIYSFRTSFGFMIQVPFFIAAYTLLSKYTGLNGTSFLFIHNLGQIDGLLSIGSININLLPFLMTIFNLISSFLYTKGLSKGEKFKLFFMALVFLVLLYNSPAGLVMYWTMNNIYSLMKNIIHNPVKLETN